ncbi:MAG TPA: hypothetical protein VN821_03040, partial [Candidatus Udaeobacter sp.]|nr:hypothetical protein [Candidatus Udaeobacter sp.]
MTTSTISLLSKPSGDDQIPLGTLAYFRERHRNRVYELVLNEFMASGLSQADLARRLGKRPDIVCRWLGSPGNWTLDTESDLLFAISGGEPEYAISYPLDNAPRNYANPVWLSPTAAPQAGEFNKIVFSDKLTQTTSSSETTNISV